MKVTELNREEMTEVKERFIMGDLQLPISQGELINIDDIVTDELMYLVYADTEFVEEDFFCNI